MRPPGRDGRGRGLPAARPGQPRRGSPSLAISTNSY